MNLVERRAPKQQFSRLQLLTIFNVFLFLSLSEIFLREILKIRIDKFVRLLILTIFENFSTKD